MGIGVGDWDWGLRLRIEIGDWDWDWDFGLELGIGDGEFGLIESGISFANWDEKLGLGISILIGIEIRDGDR